MNEIIKNKILIVDDDPDITSSFDLSLEDTGLFEVETYNDSTKALSNFQANSYDLVLLDIKMPKMNGFELCDKIRKLDGNVKVCFLSAFDPYSNELKEQFLSSKIECFIPKPIETKELVKRIEVELSR
jgi:two-component system catabolic regulation response regulator CreB/two-component system response regulator ChvI